MLPQGHDHSGHDTGQAIQDGRVDIIISHVVAGQMAQAPPVMQALFSASRAVLDGALTAVAGPVAIDGVIRQGVNALGYGRPKRKVNSASKQKKSTAVAKRTPKKREKGKEYTAAGIEIVDAEFVDIIEPRGQR